MGSSTQFSIRGLMIITVAVAIVAALVATPIRHLGPQEQQRSAAYFSLLAVVVAMVTSASCLNRRRVERSAGSLLSRTRIAGNRLSWAILIAAVGLSAAVAYSIVMLASIDTSVYGWTGVTAGLLILFGFGFAAAGPLFSQPGSGEKTLRRACNIAGLVTMFLALASMHLSAGYKSGFGTALFFTLFLGSVANLLYLWWWWGTGPFVTEISQNGLVLLGEIFRPWSVLVSYEPSPDSPTVLIVNVSPEHGSRPIRIRVAAHDRADWERILSDNGVPHASSLLENRDASPLQPPA